MKIGVIGYTGFIGRALVKHPGFVPMNCDITDAKTVRLAIGQIRPDAIANLACLSKVDFCEDKGNQERVIQVNLRGAFNVFNEAQQLDIPVIHLSTDHVFSGKWGPTRSGPYGERSKPNPINFYGLSKLASERTASTFDNVKVVRTSRLFNEEVLRQPEQSYPTFIKRSFMYLPHFIRAFKVYVDSFYDLPKLLHISGSETVSWYDFMTEVSLSFGVPRPPRRSGAYPAGAFAPRPYHAGLKTALSQKWGIPQFSYSVGIKDMRTDSLVGQLIGQDEHSIYRHTHS